VLRAGRVLVESMSLRKDWKVLQEFLDEFMIVGRVVGDRGTMHEIGVDVGLAVLGRVHEHVVLSTEVRDVVVLEKLRYFVGPGVDEFRRWVGLVGWLKMRWKAWLFARFVVVGGLGCGLSLVLV